MPDFLTRRNGMWHFVRRVPFDKRGVVRHSTKVRTASDRTGRQAMRVADRLNSELEAHWRNLAGAAPNAAISSYDEARKRARSLGFEYLDSADIVPLPFVQRLVRLESLLIGGLENNSGARAAVLGTRPRPSFPRSKLFEEYEAATSEETRKFSPNQLRVWRSGRKGVVRELIAVVGDKPVTELTEEDGLDYSEWWRERVLANDARVNSANKSMGRTRRGRFLLRGRL